MYLFSCGFVWIVLSMDSKVVVPRNDTTYRKVPKGIIHIRMYKNKEIDVLIRSYILIKGTLTLGDEIKQLNLK